MKRLQQKIVLSLKGEINKLNNFKFLFKKLFNIAYKMTNCRALVCTNHSTSNKNISFHRLSAKKEEIKKKWLHNLNRKFIPETLCVCSEHFEPSCFKRDLQAELMDKANKHTER